MQPPLLETKISAPPGGPSAVRRERLLQALEREVWRVRLALVSAPAGYGKTSLLAQWARQQRDENGKPAVAWLTLDEADDELERFFRYLLAAWERAQPGIMDSPLGVLLSDMQPDSEAVLAAFVNEGRAREGHLAFVLDDYHVIADEAIHEALTFLLDHLPPSLHFVLASRAEPPLPVARYRARRQLFELGPEDLAFTAQETAHFLTENMALELGDEALSRLHEQCDGWAAGLQLAALGLRRRGAAGETVAVSGRQRFIADYLAQDVLARQEAPVRSFLLQTSILQQLSGPLCDALIGGEGSRQMLERLHRENLFLEPLDDERRWFRYHPLFGEFLREEAGHALASELPGLHRRAARWYMDHQRPEPAFEHAVEGDDAELGLQIFERYVQGKLFANEFRRVQEWLQALPDAWFDAYPQFGLVRAGLLLFTGQIEACARRVDEIEERLASERRDDLGEQQAQISAVRCSIACFHNDLTRAEKFADAAFRALSDENTLFRAIVYGSLGDTYRRNGLWDKAEECYLNLLPFMGSPGFRVQSAHVYGALADLELRRGALQKAAGYWRRALAAIEEPENWGRLPLPLTGWVHIRMGEVLYEWNELEEARAHAQSGLERAELGGDVRALIAGYLLAGRLHLAQGEVQAAAAYLEQARPHVEGAHFPGWAARFERFQLELWLVQERLRAAVHWVDRMETGGEEAQRLDRAELQLALARVLIVKGDTASLQRALALLERLLEAAEAEGRMAVTIEALALQATARRRRGDEAGALTSLENALRLAEPEGYVRLFADLGFPLARLLQEARRRDVMSNYVEMLLAAFDDAAHTAAGQPLIEPLTDREQDVLELMAAGLTNREIGEELVISAGTVKKHAGNIYGKLDVGNRTEAVARARELDLL